MIQSDVRQSDFMESESESLLTYPHVYRHVKIILQMSRYLIESVCVCVCVCVSLSLSLSSPPILPSCGSIIKLCISIFFPRIDDSYCDRIHSSLTAVCCFGNGYVAWKENCSEYWLKELQKSI